MSLLNLTNRLLGKTGLRLSRTPPLWYNPHCVTLQPAGAERGRILLAYVIEPFLSKDGPSSSHTHHGESQLMADVWLQRGYIVDVIDYDNPAFVPKHRYDYFVSARTNIQRIRARLNDDCRCIVHLDTSHYTTNNRDALARVVGCQQRRGVDLFGSVRMIEVNAGIEAADAGVVLGNDETASTYAYAGKPLYPLDVPAVVDLPWSDSKDFAAARSRFVWLGSDGAVHKGLDVALEAFASLPDCHLSICGPIDRDPAFCAAYAAELALPNIEQLGWVDVSGEQFANLVATSAALVYPSCREGQAGAAVNCIRAGLIPIVSRETGVDVEGFGTQLADCDVTTIIEAVKAVSQASPQALYTRARATWEHGQARFSHDAYRQRYGEIVDQLTSSNTEH